MKKVTCERIEKLIKLTETLEKTMLAMVDILDDDDIEINQVFEAGYPKRLGDFRECCIEVAGWSEDMDRVYKDLEYVFDSEAQLRAALVRAENRLKTLRENGWMPGMEDYIAAATRQVLALRYQIREISIIKPKSQEELYYQLNER